MSKVILDCLDFALPSSVIGSENSRHPLDQSEAKLTPITTWSPSFSRALASLVLTSSFLWLLRVSFSLLISLCDFADIFLLFSIYHL